MARKFCFDTKKKKKIYFFKNDEDEIDINQVTDAYIELFSNKEMTLSGCYGVFEYREDYIKLNMKKGTLILCGNKFDITSFEENVICIRGNISTIEFCY